MSRIVAVAAALTGLAAFFLILYLWAGRLRREAVESLRRAVEGDRVYRVEDCRYLGMLSRGHAQVRGNGVLALTGRGLHFRMLLPRRHVFIPLRSLRSVSTPRSFLGKIGPAGLLRVDFTGPDGGEDACAFAVSSPRWWSGALEALLSGHEPPELRAL